MANCLSNRPIELNNLLNYFQPITYIVETPTKKETVMSVLLTIGLGYYLFTAKESGPRTARVINTIFTLISVT
jgi:hypothetical protein